MNSVGNFFVKIGLGIKKGFFGLINWVKNTAWVQPLLIVGVIFGAILSIKPVTSWIGGLLNPDETYAFYTEHNTKNLFTGKQIDDFIASNKGDTIIVYYSDSDSTCADMEKELRRLASDHSNYTWKCVNTNVTDKDSDEYKDLQNFDSNATYFNAYEGFVNNKSYKEMFDAVGLDSLQSSTIPTPMFVRLSDNQIVGIKLNDFKDDRALDMKRFLTDTIDTDWSKTWTEYKNDNR